LFSESDESSKTQGEALMLGIDLITLSMLISSRQQSSAVSFAVWIVLGLMVGFFASKVFNKTGYGLRRDCLLGVVGAIVGGFFSNLLRKSSEPGVDVYSALVAVVGAVVFLLVYYALFRRRRFLSMKYPGR
jgi:uncharacterized membrane protein YeaQ/YmgE (transglycosylase-associated protein family)